MARPHLVFSHHQNKVTAGVVVVCLVLDGGGLGLDDGDPVLLPDLEGDLLRTERFLELLDAPAGEESSPCLLDVREAWTGCRGGGGSAIRTLRAVLALWM